MLLSSKPRILILSAGLACVMEAQVLYDPSLGTLPTAQGWSLVSSPGARPPILTDGFLRIADISRHESLIGISRLAPLPLDRSIGFRLAFQLQATLEDHGNRPDRSGISLTVIGNDRKGIELGFWDFSIWAQSDSPLFVHSEEAAWFTHSHLAYYVLTIQGNTYSLTADGMALLTGPLTTAHFAWRSRL